MAALPEKARVVIIGQGGIVGASVMHHLVEAGWDDIVGIEKSAIPTDIGSTSHASDFCYMTSHDKLNVFTSTYSREFYKSRGNFIEIGGMEVARKGDEAQVQELLRKVASGKAFGTNARMITAAEAKERFPLLEEDTIECAMWDPDAGLVTLEKPLTVEPLGIAISKDDPQFLNLVDNYLDAYGKTGILAAMRKKWFEDGSWVAALP